jgi:hypothetical protein
MHPAAGLTALSGACVGPGDPATFHRQLRYYHRARGREWFMRMLVAKDVGHGNAEG